MYCIVAYRIVLYDKAVVLFEYIYFDLKKNDSTINAKKGLFMERHGLF
jgi:hypothetical protein